MYSIQKIYLEIKNAATSACDTLLNQNYVEKMNVRTSTSGAVFAKASPKFILDSVQ